MVHFTFEFEIVTREKYHYSLGWEARSFLSYKSPFGLNVREPKSRNEIQSVSKTIDFYF